jgi:hypothetical protein
VLVLFVSAWSPTHEGMNAEDKWSTGMWPIKRWSGCARLSARVCVCLTCLSVCLPACMPACLPDLVCLLTLCVCRLVCVSACLTAKLTDRLTG